MACDERVPRDDTGYPYCVLFAILHPLSIDNQFREVPEGMLGLKIRIFHRAVLCISGAMTRFSYCF